LGVLRGKVRTSINGILEVHVNSSTDTAVLTTGL
jgi:hypothetical protein